MITDEAIVAEQIQAAPEEKTKAPKLTPREADCDFAPLTKEESLRFSPQDFLMEHIEKFSTAAVRDNHAFRYVLPITQGLPSKINQWFIGTPGIGPFMNIDAKTFAQITPKIDLFKVVHPVVESGGKLSHKTKIEVPIPFNKTFSKDEKDRILQNRHARGVGAGVISFDWELAGTNPAEARTFITANLKIYLKSIAELDIVRATYTDKNEEEYELRYLDLIRREIKMIRPSKNRFGKKFSKRDRPDEVYNPNYFLLKANVGWRVNDSFEDRGTGIKNALKACQTTMYLSLFKHEIDFQEDGSVILTCNYNGYVNSLLSNMDLFNPLKRTKSSVYGDIDFEHYQNILKELIGDTGRLYFADVVRTAKPIFSEEGEKLYDDAWEAEDVEIGMYNIIGETGQDADSELVLKELTGTEADDKALQDFNKTSNFDKGYTQNTFRIKYFYFGDLLDAVLKYAYKEPGMDSVRFMVGPVILDDPKDKDGQQMAINLCDIPISLDMYQIWFQEHIVNKKLPNLSVNKFLQMAFSTLIKGALMSRLTKGLYCKNQKNAIRIPKLAFSQFTLPESGNGSDPIFGPDFNPLLDIMPQQNTRIAYGNFLKKNLFQTANNTDIKHYQYFLMYSANSDAGMYPVNVGEPEGNEDAVYYFSIGRRNNIVRSIKFKMQDVPNLSEANMERSGLKDTILRGFYNATITLEGAPVFKPGMIIYIDSVAMGAGVGTKSLTEKLGFGGFYMVLKASHEIQQGNFETTLECLWKSFGSREIPVRFIDHKPHDPYQTPSDGPPVGG